MSYYRLEQRDVVPIYSSTLIGESTVASNAANALCTVALPSGGVLKFNDSYTTRLSDSITFEQPCDNSSVVSNNDQTGNSTVVGLGEPFYASISPQIYALATATVCSYLLVIIIFITPRTFFVGGPGGGAGFLGRGGRMPGFGSSSVIGVGRRPLLQKIATLTVAVSLTIATADTFKVAQEQYAQGYMDSSALVQKVVASIEIRVIRVISDTFLWLAQVQTLIRLFPRHKEKVTIKWLGFGLVICDTVFSILENFVSDSIRSEPRSFQDAIPALSYLFELSISLIYASCVIYYCLSKRRFAFWHSKMRNVLLVAILSLSSVLVPVVFFILDVSQPNIASWGEYIRWVGAAAASVVVWEWVERIEALERDEKKDGILGREIFDGDEMLDMTPSDSGRHGGSHYFGGNGGTDVKLSNMKEKVAENLHIRPRLPFRKQKPGTDQGKGNKGKGADTQKVSGSAIDGNITRPPQAATPISRSDTTSAASTVYQVRYHNVGSPSPAIPEEPLSPTVSNEHNHESEAPKELSDESTLGGKSTDAPDDLSHQRKVSQAGTITNKVGMTGRQVWHSASNPFKRKRTEPPAEVAAQFAQSYSRRSPGDRQFNLRTRLRAFNVVQREGFRNGSDATAVPLPVTVIPAQPRTLHPATRDDSRTSAAVETQPEQSSQDAEPMFSFQPRRDSMPVTFIPAPVRGGRTWSPDDLPQDDDEASSSGAANSSKSSAPNLDSTSAADNGQPDGNIHSVRGSLLISESPGRTRDRPSGNSPSSWRRSARQRGTTLSSISDRLDSVSPSVQGTRSATADSDVQGNG